MKRFIILSMLLAMVLLGCDDTADKDASDATTLDAAVASDTSPGGPDSSAQVDASAQENRVFISSASYDGALGGLDGGDAKCQALADAAGLGGTWIAWLSTASTNAIDRLNDSGPWVDMEGKVFFASKAAIADLFSDPETSLWLDENATFLASDRIWTGTSGTGAFEPGIGDACQAWTSNAMADQARIGQVGRSDNSWTAFSNTTCDQLSVHLICFEQ